MNPNLTLERIVSEVPRCPMCAHESYIVAPVLFGRKVVLQTVSCSKCGADILHTFRTLTAKVR